MEGKLSSFFNKMISAPKEFADKIRELDALDLRKRLVENGTKHAATFSWNHSAKTLLRAIHQLCKDPM
jgi:hypothetical protein